MRRVELKSAYDREDDGDKLIKGRASPRPKDAATLMLVRRDAAQPRVLKGSASASVLSCSAVISTAFPKGSPSGRLTGPTAVR